MTPNGVGVSASFPLIHATRRIAGKDKNTMTENTPKSSDTHPTLITIDGASMLADAASEHLRSLDAYKHFIRTHKPTPESHQAEAAYRNKVRSTEEDLKQATSKFKPGFEAAGREFSGPKLGFASALLHACMAYLEGQERRAEASAHWLQQRSSLGEAEKEIGLVEALEQEVRRTLLAYQQHRAKAVLHGLVGRTHSPLPRSGSGDADGLRASQLPQPAATGTLPPSEIVPMTEVLFRAIYVSTARHDLRDEELASLLDVSRHNNAAQGITGALGYHDRSFIQVLEGPKGPVEALLATIACDARNTGMFIIHQSRIDDRVFGEWSMGWLGASDLTRAGFDPGVLLMLDTPSTMVNTMFDEFRRTKRLLSWLG